MKRKVWQEHKNITKLYYGMDEKFFIHHIDIWIKNGYSLSKIIRHTECLVDIVKNNNYDNAYTLLKKYQQSKSQKEKLRIRYGRGRVDLLENKLKKRNRGKTVSCWKKEYWLEKGYAEEEANVKIQEYQKQNGKKRKKFPTKEWKVKLKHCLDYWLEKGYTEEEAEILRKPYLSYNTLEGFIGRHGEVIGEKKYLECIEKYKQTMKQNLSKRKQAGYVSKESKKFFIEIYKMIRKLGIQRKEIYFGINGSREFFLRKNQTQNEGRFVDFCVPKLNLCIEYNGTFWHGRERDEWKNPFIDYEYSIMKDNELKLLCEDRNFDLVVVWSDDSKDDMINKIKEIVYAKMGN